jgi:hypothetical protein
LVRDQLLEAGVFAFVHVEEWDVVFRITPFAVDERCGVARGL